MCSMVKLTGGTTLDSIMPVTWSGLSPALRNRLVTSMPYSSLVLLRLVESRQ